jgi:hypothetical protein
MPLKLPAPDLGTEEQAGPKSVVVAAPEPAAAGADDAGADDAGAEAGAELAGLEGPLEDPLELQAATLRAQVRASPDRAINLRFTLVSLRDLSLPSEVRLGAVPWMRDRLM